MPDENRDIGEELLASVKEMLELEKTRLRKTRGRGPTVHLTKAGPGRRAGHEHQPTGNKLATKFYGRT